MSRARRNWNASCRPSASVPTTRRAPAWKPKRPARWRVWKRKKPTSSASRPSMRRNWPATRSPGRRPRPSRRWSVSPPCRRRAPSWPWGKSSPPPTTACSTNPWIRTGSGWIPPPTDSSGNPMSPGATRSGGLTPWAAGPGPTKVGPGSPRNPSAGSFTTTGAGPSWRKPAGSGCPAKSGHPRGFRGARPTTWSAGHRCPPKRSSSRRITVRGSRNGARSASRAMSSSKSSTSATGCTTTVIPATATGISGAVAGMSPISGSVTTG